MLFSEKMQSFQTDAAPNNKVFSCNPITLSAAGNFADSSQHFQENDKKRDSKIMDSLKIW